MFGVVAKGVILVRGSENWGGLWGLELRGNGRPPQSQNESQIGVYVLAVMPDSVPINLRADTQFLTARFLTFFRTVSRNAFQMAFDFNRYEHQWSETGFVRLAVRIVPFQKA